MNAPAGPFALASPTLQTAADGAALLEVVHETRYAYSSPVATAQHRLHLKPLQDERQTLLHWHLSIDPAAGHERHGRDVFGNEVGWVQVDRPHSHLAIIATSRVQVMPPPPWAAHATVPWESLRERLRYAAAGGFAPAVEFVQPSPFVPRLAELRDWAAPSFAPGTPVGLGALDLMHRLHEGFEYRSRSTEVHTPLARAFAQRTGVCQDFAHLMIGGLRMLGLPARYVSGYLLTVTDADRAPLVGADASHAWVQVWCPSDPDAGSVGQGAWVDLDPTNDQVVSTDHIRLGVGRDYGDVAPVRGVIQGGGRHALSVGVTTRRLGPARELLEASRKGATAANERH